MFEPATRVLWEGAAGYDRWATMTMHRTEAERRLEARLESIERRMYVDLYRALPSSVGRDCGISWSIEEGVLRLTCETRDHPYFNRTMGVPGDRGGVESWLDGLLEHYRRHGVRRWMLQLAPGDCAAEIERLMIDRGLVRLRGWAKHAGRPTEVSAPRRECDLVVERIDGDRAAEFASLIVPAFQFPAAAARWPASTVGRSGWRHYLALDGSEPVACAAMYVVDRVATLTFAATRESQRRRGAQSALISRRLRDAQRLEVDWIVTETDDEVPERPNPSYRNIVRCGMPVRYVRANWGPPPPG